MLKTFLKLIKIKHYVKNAVCFVPLVFSLNFTNPALVLRASFAFLAFCLVSSAVYIFNDIFDLKEDRLSPKKAERPLASGKISIPVACIVMLSLLLAGFAFCIGLNLLSILILILYVILNIFYTTFLKNFEIIDAFCIALGFILRILAGCAAIMVLPSPLVILLTFFVSMFFTFSKRRLEFEKGGAHKRKSVEKFTLEALNQFVSANAILSIAFYFAYVMDSATIERAGTGFLYISAIPFSLVIFRLLFLANTSAMQDPADFLYKDKPAQILLFAYFFTLFAILIF